MNRNLVYATIAVAFFAATAVMIGKYGGADTSGIDNRGVLGDPRPRQTRERGHREKLVTDSNGNLVGLSAFEANLRLDGTFATDSPDYRRKLLVNYIELALLSNPGQALSFLRESQAQWAGDPLAAPTILKKVAATLSLEATREFLDIITSRDVLINVATGLSLDLKDGDALAMVDFFLDYDATLLANEAVMANLMLKAGGGIDGLAGLFRKLPRCEERASAARVLARKAHSLGTEEFGKFYQEISPYLTAAEVREMHTELAGKMDSLEDPKLAFLLADGFQGDANALMAVAAASADVNLDDSLRILNSMDLAEKDRNTVFSGIMRSWAQYAPKKAAQYAYSSYQSGEINEQAMNVVFGEWINRDTSAAVSYFGRLDLDMQAKRMVDLSHFPNVASYSIEDGLALLQERQNDPDYPPVLVDQMRRDFALSDGAHHSPQVVLGELSKIKDIDIRDSSFFRFSSALASEDLFKAVSLAARTTVPSQRDQMLLGALAPAISYDMNYSHDMIRHISDPRRRDDAYIQWYDIARKTEPHLAAEWLRSLENTNPPLYEEIYK